MRYIYMFCLVLSSLFTYKQIYAETYLTRYAFFIPKNAFQKNVGSVSINASESSALTTYNLPKEEADIAVNPIEDEKPQGGQKKATLPAKQVVAEKKVVLPPKKEVAVQRNVKKTPQIPQENQIEIVVKEEEAAPLNSSRITVENMESKSLKELLAALPYPDFRQPKFKQLYAIYALDLRTLYREGNFLANPEQDTALAKANSVRRFDVK